MSPPVPERVDDAAFYGLAGDVVDLLEPHSEGDPAAILLQFLVAVGNACGRQPGFRVGIGQRHHLNLFILVVGDTATGRKGTSAADASYIVRQADATWPGTRHASWSSGEGAVMAVRDETVKRRKAKKAERAEADPDGYIEEVVDEGVQDKRLLVLESEFANTLSVIQREGSTFSSTARAAWDGLDLEFLVKKTQTKATGAHVSTIGHITMSELLARVSEVDVASGFLNRFILVWARRSKSLPFGSALTPDAPELHAVIAGVRQALQHAQVIGDMPFGEEARSLWRPEYERLFYDGQDGLAARVLARAQPQVRRLACIYAVLDMSSVVKAEHLRAALALWDYSERTVRSIFADATGDPKANRILAELKKSDGGLSRTQIRDLFDRHLSRDEVDRALETLVASGRAFATKAPTAGRSKEVWNAH